MKNLRQKLSNALSTLLSRLGRAASPLTGPYQSHSCTADVFEVKLPAGFFEWRATFDGAAPDMLELTHAGAAPVRVPVQARGATGLIELGATETLVITAQGLELSLRFDIRRLNSASLAARIMALPQNRRAILNRWARYGSDAAARALITASRGALIEDYAEWIAAYEAPQQDRDLISTWVKTLPAPPLISVVTPVYASDTLWLRACLESVQLQAYPHWEHCLVDDCSPREDFFAFLQGAARDDQRLRVARRAANGGIAAATNDAIAMAQGAWIAFLDHDDTLSTDALALAAAAIAETPEARIIYTDEDKIDDAGVRSEPYMKGGWDPTLFAAQNYLNHLTLIRRDLIDEAGGLRSTFDGSQDYDLLLRCTARVKPEQIVHIPAVAYHWRFGVGGGNYSVQQAEKTQRRMREAFTANTKTDASLELAADGLRYPRLRPALPDTMPLVSLIIPTRDGAALLAQCIKTLKEKAGWPHVEIIVMDNDSAAPDTLELFETLRKVGVRIEQFPGVFNFSAINNAGARIARGAILGFVNNDVEALSDGWLTELVRWFSQPRVAAVGAKLLYPDGRVQHAGLVTGINGSAGHLFKYREGSDPGPFGLLARAREVSALTAACLLVHAEAFSAVGGFDEAAFAVAFNDVDLCLRLGAAGHRLVWTPDSVLMHHESVSRGPDDETAEKRARLATERNRLRERWGARLDHDPCYSPNRSLSDETGALAWPPRYRRPWVI